MRPALKKPLRWIVGSGAALVILLAITVIAGYLGAISPRYAFWARPKYIHLDAAQIRLEQLLPPNTELDPSSTRIIIHKSRRELELWSSGMLLKTCKIALGGKPVGPKTAKGDGRTPEGEYFICTELDRSRFHLFLGLNYPNAADARRALDAGSITRDEFEKFESAAKARREPDWTTAMGGAIGIHGGGTFRDWTLGCIALSNEDIEDVWLASRNGTPVTIKE